MKLLIPVQESQEWTWLDAFDFNSHGIIPVVLHCGPPEAAAPLLRTRTIEWDATATGGPRVPKFAAIINAFREEEAHACFVMEDGMLGRLVGVAADMADVPVFRVVTTPEQLRNMSTREKRRPDLFFLAHESLLADALDDQRYGSTVAPTGHPARDLALRTAREDGAQYEGPGYGDGTASVRILEMIDCWRHDRIATAQPDISVIVPAYRESGNLEIVCARLLDALSGISSEILLIDDASPDDTYAKALEQMWRSPSIRAFTKGTPRGMGNAIIHGVARARAPVLAVTMADGSDDVARIPEMLRKVRDEGFSLAIGSRYRIRENYEHIPQMYRLWSRCFRITVRILIGLRLVDYTNAFRVFHRDIFARYGPESGGFEISPEITFKAWFATRKVAEVDVKHLKRATGQSNFSFLRAGPGYGKILIKAFVNRITGHWFTLDW